MIDARIADSSPIYTDSSTTQSDGTSLVKNAVRRFLTDQNLANVGLERRLPYPPSLYKSKSPKRRRSKFERARTTRSRLSSRNQLRLNLSPLRPLRPSPLPDRTSDESLLRSLGRAKLLCRRAENVVRRLRRVRILSSWPRSVLSYLFIYS